MRNLEKGRHVRQKTTHLFLIPDMITKKSHQPHSFLFDFEELVRGEIGGVVYEQYIRLYPEWTVKDFLEKVVEIVRNRDDGSIEDPQKITQIFSDEEIKQINDGENAPEALKMLLVATVYGVRAGKALLSPDKKSRMLSYLSDAYYWIGKANAEIGLYLNNRDRKFTLEQIKQLVRKRNSSRGGKKRQAPWRSFENDILFFLHEKVLFQSKKWPTKEAMYKETHQDARKYGKGKKVYVGEEERFKKTLRKRLARYPISTDLCIDKKK